MRAQWTIGKKLIASFIGVATITLILGIVGYYGAVKGEHSISKIGGEPCWTALHVIKENAEMQSRAVMRTLMIPGLALGEPPGGHTRTWPRPARPTRTARKRLPKRCPRPSEERQRAGSNSEQPANGLGAIEKHKLVEMSKQIRPQQGCRSGKDVARQLEPYTKDPSYSSRGSARVAHGRTPHSQAGTTTPAAMPANGFRP